MFCSGKEWETHSKHIHWRTQCYRGLVVRKKTKKQTKKKIYKTLQFKLFDKLCQEKGQKQREPINQMTDLIEVGFVSYQQ